MGKKNPANILTVGSQGIAGEIVSGLEDAGYTLSPANSPLAAMTLLADNRFDVIVCDDEFGPACIEFVVNLRAAGISTPIIILTGNANALTDDEALRDQGVEILPKANLTAELLHYSFRFAASTTGRQRLLQSILDSTDAGILVVNADGTPAAWNPAFTEMAMALIGNGPETVPQFAEYAFDFDHPELSIGERTIERRLTHLPDGVTILALHDMTERLRSQEERLEADLRVAYLAHNDSLTGLPNRTACTDRLWAEVRKADLFRSGFYVLNLDLNKFKEVNDVFGHAVGDGLLREISSRLKACLKDDEYIARFGGDEFVALQRFDDADTHIPDLARRLLEAVDRPFSIDGNFVRTGISIGVSAYPDHGADPEQLLANADSAMYRAKNNPHEKVSVFDETLDKAIRERRALANDLKDAVAAGKLDVFFQPQAIVDDRRIFGYEALARWNHDFLGWVSPSTFIPIAEENGLIIKLGELVLRRACEIAAGWPDPYAIAVNVSAVQIGYTDLAGIVRSALEESGLTPDRLELEITETVLIEDPDRALQVLQQLKEIGVSIAMDDFGTGYSSLSSLLSFPFDKIKIDRSFVDSMNGNPQAVEIVRAILGLGRNLRFNVIAEGVETEEHVQFLREEGCREMQGYLIGRPISADEVVQQIAENDAAFEDQAESMSAARAAG
ncbi:MAG TPA: EAL domain-containing protein [Afifellaceae bacterium]|nr:EAL domain-containing protein [Afifellaceae bacterium]